MRPVVYSFSDSFSHVEIIGKSVVKEEKKKRKETEWERGGERDRERQRVRERTKGELSHIQ